MEEQKLYVPAEDPYFSQPYIDVEEWRDKPVRHYFVHGGFKGTEIDGANEARFCFYFPEKDKYEGRFFQYVSPAPEDEHESEHLKGEDDKISFCLTHGAYYVVSNQGGFVLNDMTGRLYRTSSNAAEFSRTVAKRIYETEDRPYGYIFGGSGGSFKTLGCMEATEGVWDGAVPYVLANPMAAPNVFAPRMRAVRMLGEEGLKRVVAAMEPGGSGDIYEGLDELQRQALEEATKMGFPPRAWFCHPFMGDGALMVLVPTVYMMFPTYFKDFWEKEGYAGADPESNEYKARVQHITTVTDVYYDKPVAASDDEGFTSVDNSWVNTMLGGEPLPRIRIAEPMPEGSYQFHCRFRVLDGECAGAEINIDELDGCDIKLHPENGGANNANPFKNLKPGDKVMIDNSDAIAIQCFHRHQVPDATYKVYDQFKDADGNPLYPQLPMKIAEFIATSGAGLLINGNMHGKIIALCSMLDESACPWHGDWYREAVRRHGVDEENQFRLYYTDNCIHDDRAGYLDDPQHQIDYLGVLHQALLDVANWCEKGIKPLDTVNYTFEDGQIYLPDDAKERGGMQPTVKASVKAAADGSEQAEADDMALGMADPGNGRDTFGGKVAYAKAGQPVSFTAVIEVPPMAGSVTAAAWDYERTNDWSHEEALNTLDDGRVLVETTHVFDEPGVYYPVIKVKSNRHGDASDIFTQIKNLDRVKVVVE